MALRYSAPTAGCTAPSRRAFRRTTTSATATAAAVRPPAYLQRSCRSAREQAYALGFRRIVLTGCTGGRQDHHIAALQLLETISRRGCEGRLLDPDNEIAFCPPGHYTLEQGGFRFFSLLPVEAQLTATIRHALYSLEAGVICRGDSLGVSNAFLDGPVELFLTGGGCWLVRSGRIE